MDCRSILDIPEEGLGTSRETFQTASSDVEEVDPTGSMRDVGEECFLDIPEPTLNELVNQLAQNAPVQFSAA